MRDKASAYLAGTRPRWCSHRPRSTAADTSSGSSGRPSAGHSSTTAPPAPPCVRKGTAAASSVTYGVRPARVSPCVEGNRNLGARGTTHVMQLLPDESFDGQERVERVHRSARRRLRSHAPHPGGIVLDHGGHGARTTGHIHHQLRLPCCADGCHCGVGRTCVPLLAYLGFPRYEQEGALRMERHSGTYAWGDGSASAAVRCSAEGVYAGVRWWSSPPHAAAPHASAAQAPPSQRTWPTRRLSLHTHRGPRQPPIRRSRRRAHVALQAQRSPVRRAEGLVGVAMGTPQLAPPCTPSLESSWKTTHVPLPLSRTTTPPVERVVHTATDGATTRRCAPGGRKPYYTLSAYPLLHALSVDGGSGLLEAAYPSIPRDC